MTEIEFSNHENDSWPSDGNDHKDVGIEHIFINAKILQFLNNDRISLVIANKGMGKTLLMRVKHKILRDRVKNSTGSYIIISGNNREIDEPRFSRTMPQTGYGDVLFWKDLWSVSIILSIICSMNADGYIDKDSKNWHLLLKAIEHIEIAESFKEEIIIHLENSIRAAPSYFLTFCIHSYSEKEIVKLNKSTTRFYSAALNHIQSSTIAMIDGFDQALSEAFGRNVNAWKAGQTGLAKAAHSLFTTSRHIKVIATIRQEAWAGFVDDHREVISGKSLILDYTDAELKGIINVAVIRYTGKKSISDLIGYEFIENAYLNIKEDPFTYLLRHSSGSPRSLMHFGKAVHHLHSPDPSKRMEQIRDEVDVVAASNISEDYLSGQKSNFLRTLTSQDRIKKLLKLIPANVLTRDSIISINREFSALIGIPEHESHPFCDLINIGLVGKVKQDIAQGGKYQHFRKPYEFDWSGDEIPNDSGIYVIHPGLASSITRHRSIHMNKVNVIGNDQKWNTVKRNDGSTHYGIPKIFISHSSADKPFVEKCLQLFKEKMNMLFPCEYWYDKHNIFIGESISERVEAGVKESDIVLLFASKNSLLSGWVEGEWRTKHKREIEQGVIGVMVALIDNTSVSDLPEFLKGKLSIQITEEDMQSQIQELVESAHHNIVNIIDSRL